MAKEVTTIMMDKERHMSFPYSIVKKLEKDVQTNIGKDKSESENLEYLLYLSLLKDDPSLKQEDIENILDDADMSEVIVKLNETIERDMPGLINLPDDKSESPNQLPQSVNP